VSGLIEREKEKERDKQKGIEREREREREKHQFVRKKKLDAQFDRFMLWLKVFPIAAEKAEH
jgi:hypothetical protein